MEKIVEIENPGIITDYAFMDTTFVKLTTNDLWEIRMQYPHLHMQNAETECFVRQDVYEMLILAAGYLPKDYRFCIWDAWRPFSLQKELYTTYIPNVHEGYGTMKLDTGSLVYIPGKDLFYLIPDEI